MYNNYNLETSRIFKDAEKIMISLNHGYVGTEHLFLSMLKNSEEIRNLLEKYQIEYDGFLEELLLVVNSETCKKVACIYTPLLKKVIKNAEMHAKNSYITPLMLLESLLEEGEGIAIRILISMGLDIDKLYDEIKLKDKKSNQKLEIYNIGKEMSKDLSDNFVVGREKEIDLITETLLRKNKNNPLLIGDAGVGKSAIVEELARRIKKGDVPNALKNKKIISIEMSSLVAGTKYRGEFEEKLNKIIKEVENNPEIILFIDEIHTLSNAGGAEGAINASDILKPYLARGKIKVIGATTTNEYNKFIAKDKALSRRFDLIKINEPSIDETINILSKIKPSFEHHYNIKISEENIRQIVDLTNKYILDRFNPDKSIDLLDSVCAMKEVKSPKEKNIIILKNKLSNIIEAKEKMVKNNNFEEALNYRKQEIELYEKIEKEKNSSNRITNNDIKEVMLRKSNIPNMKNNWKDLKAYLNNEIVGQEEAINEIIASLKSKESDLPVSILLTGSTGVGKTKTVKEIATYLKMPLVRLDLSEYNEPVSINRLIGSSAGYVGYDDENIFDRIRMYPNSIVLLDELEKANSNVINLFLQVLDEGFITNAKGEKIDFKNTYIFMTSNAEINNKIGFMKGKSNYQNSFSKEFLGRITCIVNYKNVTEDMVKKYLSKKGIKNSLILKEFDYENQGFRGLDKYIKKKKMKVR
ncbi:MAG: ATP-dependent Clp protease ATP-binding subunit [Firmicutes bacterium]|nr:ATP-dependent Clp protease ATP-binding subunit [Bacillota bacterium]